MATASEARAARSALPGPRHLPLDRKALQLALLRAYHGFIRHRGLDSAAALSFFAALVVFPAALSIVSCVALLDDKARTPSDIQHFVDLVAPEAAVTALRGPVEQLLSVPNAGVALATGLVLTVWTLSGYVTAFGRAINTAYEVEEGREWIAVRARSLVISAALTLIGGAVVLLVSGTPAAAAAIAHSAGLPDWVTLTWDIAKWPVLAALAVLVVAVLYYYSPNVRHLRIRWVTLGAIVAIIVWVLATTGFALYVLNFSHYNRVYGWLGGAVVLLLWLYLSNLVVVLGAEMDSEIVRVRQLLAGIASQDVIQLPLRSTRRIETLERWSREDERRGQALLESSRRSSATGGSAGKKP